MTGGEGLKMYVCEECMRVNEQREVDEETSGSGGPEIG